MRMEFQKKAWCDEATMIGWIRQQWNAACDGEMLLILDDYRAQKTDNVQSHFTSRSTTTVYVPPGYTSIVQPLDVSANAPFKAIVRCLANDHCVSAYVQGTIPAGERRALLTKWVGGSISQQADDPADISQVWHFCSH